MTQAINSTFTNYVNLGVTSPDLQMSTGGVSSVDGNQPHNNVMPGLVINYIIAITGVFPTSG